MSNTSLFGQIAFSCLLVATDPSIGLAEPTKDPALVPWLLGAERGEAGGSWAKAVCSRRVRPVAGYKGTAAGIMAGAVVRE